MGSIPVRSSPFAVGRSVEGALGLGAVEREGRNLDIELLAACRHHAVGSDHEPGRRRQRHAAGVLVGCARLEHRFLAHHAGAANLLHPAERVGDAPVTGLELDRLGTVVADLDGVGPEEIALLLRRAFGQEFRGHRHFDVAGHRLVHGRSSAGVWQVVWRPPLRQFLRFRRIESRLGPARNWPEPIAGTAQLEPRLPAFSPSTDLPSRQNAIVVWRGVPMGRAADDVRNQSQMPPAAAPAGRDLRLDLFRGLALWLIYLDHIPSNMVSWVTIRNYGFSDATEIFVFISGYTAAYVYGREMNNRGFVVASARILKRTWQIYVAHIFLFVIYMAEIAYVAASFENPLYSEEMGILNFLKQPDVTIIEAMLLKFKPANMDVLPLYIILLGAFPPMLWLLLRNATVALAVSVGLYGVVWWFDLNFPA